MVIKFHWVLHRLTLARKWLVPYCKRNNKQSYMFFVWNINSKWVCGSLTFIWPLRNLATYIQPKLQFHPIPIQIGWCSSGWISYDVTRSVKVAKFNITSYIATDNRYSGDASVVNPHIHIIREVFTKLNH